MVTPHNIPSSGEEDFSAGDRPFEAELGRGLSTDEWVFGLSEPSRPGLWARFLGAWDRFSSSWASLGEGTRVGNRSVAGISARQRARSRSIISLNRPARKSRSNPREGGLDKAYVKVPPPWLGARPAPTLDLVELKKFLVDSLNDELRYAREPNDRVFVRRLIKSVGGAFSFPPFPDVARQLDTILRQGDPSMAKVVELVERDPSLVGTVWTKASGAAYSMPPSSLSLAIARIGYDALWRIGMEICMYSGVFRVRGYQALADEIRMHGIVTAEVAAWMNHGQNGPVYLAGLLHDVGKLVLLRNVSHRLEDGLPTRELLDHLFRAYHSSFSVLLARSWKLGDAVAGMVGFHHAPELAPESIQEPTRILNISDIVTHTADHYRRGLDCGGMLRLLEMESLPHNAARCISKAHEVFARIDAEERELLGQGGSRSRPS